MKTLLYFLFIFWVLRPATAQQPDATVAFERIGPAQGLSQSTVWTMYQDRRGFLWMATRDGLNRYDGQTFETYRFRPGQASSLRNSSDISALTEDGSGRLWVGSFTGGLQQLNPDGQTFTLLRQKVGNLALAGVSIGCLSRDKRGRVWAGTLGHGWLIVESGTRRVTHFRLPPSVRASEHVICALAEPDGRLWFGLDNGMVVRFDSSGRHYRIFQLPDYARDKGFSHRIVGILRSRKGDLVIATRNQGLYWLNDATGQLEHRFGKINSVTNDNLITSLTEDRQGNLWIGTDDGIRILKQGNPQNVQVFRPNPTDESSLSTHAIKSLLTDRRGNVWAGTWEGGVNVWYADPPWLEVISHRPIGPRRLTTPKVSALGTDAKGNLWVGSPSGLLRLGADGRSVQTVNPPASIPSHDVYRLFTDKQGFLYASFWNGGLVRYDAEGRSRVIPITSRTAPHILHFAQSGDGSVWMLRSDNRLFRYHAGSERVDTLPSVSRLTGLPAWETLTALWEDRSGKLWIGSFNQGLTCYDPRTGQVRRYRSNGKAGSLSDMHISALYEDKSGQLWIGTHGGGLNLKKPGSDSFTVFTRELGLSGDMIAGLEQDRLGYLWISTTEGLTRLNPATGQTSVYREVDGLPTHEFVNPGSTRLSNGDLAFATTQGLVLIHPDRFGRALPAPRAYLSGLDLFNRAVVVGRPGAPLTRPLSETTELILGPRQSVFTLKFGALTWGRTRHLTYAYQLEGLDPHWNFSDQQKNTTYTNLSPGTYLFRLKAALPGQGWGPESRLQIIIQPPWYKTVWAVGGYLLTLLGLLALIRHIVRIREKLKADIRVQEVHARTIEEVDRAKTSFFTNVSHEFKTPLTLILTPLDTLLNGELPPPERLRHQFRMMHRNASRLLHLINQLLDLSKIESGALKPKVGPGHLGQHLEAIVRSFEEMANARQIHLNHSINTGLDLVWFDPDMVEKVAGNLLANALQHTPPGGKVSLEASLAVAGWQLVVQDTGSGILPEEQARIFERFYQGQQVRASGTGIGLSLVRELVELLGGSIQVVSQPAIGSTFTVALPGESTAFPPQWLIQSESGRLPAVPPLVLSESAPSPADSSAILLIAEDDPDLNAYLSDAFRDRFRVLSATDGAEALMLARQYIPDVIISDWIMPGLEGPELCRQLKEDEKTCHIPILLLTSRASQESQLAGLAVGADDYVTKPFSAVLLQSRVDNLLLNRQRLRQSFGREVWLRPSDLKLTNLDEVFLQRATACIEEHIDDASFDAEQLQEALNLSQMQLYRKLKSLTNLSARDFIRYIRLQRAAQLLESGQVNVSEACYRVGFNDRSYFSRAFKKQFGHAPQEHAASVARPDNG